MGPFSWTNEEQKLRQTGIALGRRLQREKSAAGAIRALLKDGFLHPGAPRAASYHALLDGIGYACTDSGLLFMVQAHLWGAWAPLLFHRPDLAEKVRRSGKLLALAVTETDSGSDVYAMSSRARRAKGGWFLDGHKTFVTNGPLADGVLLFVKHKESMKEPHISCFFVSSRASQLKRSPMPARIGLCTAQACELSFRGLPVTEKDLVGAEGAGTDVFRHAMTWERSLILASSAGTLERLLEKLLATAARKKRFGGLLTKLPGFRSRVARVSECIGSMREKIRAAALELDSGGNAFRISLETKVLASRLYEEASRILLQLGGKEAFLAGSELEINLRDSLASSLYSGPNEVLESFLEQLAP